MADIQSSLDRILKRWSDAEGVPVAWENVDFEPTLKTPYVSSNMLPAETQTVGLSNVDADNSSGIYQVSIKTPRGIGTQAGREIANSLALYFAKGVIEDNMRVERFFVNGAITDDAWYMTPFSVRYRSFRRP